MGVRQSEIVHTSSIFLPGPPTQPQKPTVSRVTSNSMKLKWSAPEFDGSSPILSYQIEMLQLGSDQWQPIVQHPKNSFIVKTLEPNMSYQFRVIAYNEFGASRPSEPSEVASTKGKGWFIPVSTAKKATLSPRGECLLQRISGREYLISRPPPALSLTVGRTNCSSFSFTYSRGETGEMRV